MSNRLQITTFLRWLKFNLVGIIGAGVQMTILAACTYLAKLPYLLATVLAVECTIVHNFFWHERFTWRDRPSSSAIQRAQRLLRFNGTNGAISLVGNLLLMRLLVEQLHLPFLLANGAAILVCSALNFAVGDGFVFRATALCSNTPVTSCMPSGTKSWNEI